MQRLRPSDGSPAHRRSAGYHSKKCKLAAAPIHTTLAAEMGEKLTVLIGKVRAVEDLEDAVVDAGAALDASELGFENVIRELDGTLAQLDRENAELGAQRATFPNGFGAVIEPDGEDQLAVLPALRVRVAPFAKHDGVAAVLAKLDAAVTSFEAAVKANTAAEEKVDIAFAEELAARTAIRQQLESAHGRLRDFYKARPALAETFFLKEGRSRRKLKAEDPK